MKDKETNLQTFSRLAKKELVLRNPPLKGEVN